MQWHRYADLDPALVWLRSAMERAAVAELGFSPGTSRLCGLVRQDLAMGHVAVQFRGRPPTVLEWILDELGHKIRMEVVAPSFQLMPQLVVGTTRIATVHERLARKAARSLPFKVLSPPIRTPQVAGQSKSGGAGAGEVFGSGISVRVASARSSRLATETAFSRAMRTTLVGSMIPASIRSTYSPLAASKP
jgi:hypothetical protein